jgi:hypothetical protein
VPMLGIGAAMLGVGLRLRPVVFGSGATAAGAGAGTLAGRRVGPVASPPP